MTINSYCIEAFLGFHLFFQIVWNPQYVCSDVRSLVLELEFGGVLCWPHFNNWNSCCIWHLVFGLDHEDFVPKLHGQLTASSSVVHEIAKHINVIFGIGSIWGRDLFGTNKCFLWSSVEHYKDTWFILCNL